MTAKDENGDYLKVTRFARGRKIKRDQPIPRPSNPVETVIQIKKCYSEQGRKGWDDGEQRQHHDSLGLGARILTDLTDAELETVRADMEKRRMILYKD